MSSSMCETRRPRALPWLAALIMTALLPVPGPRAAGEATARGRNALVVWVDEQGETRSVRGREMRYVYHDRVLLRVPKDGRSHRDEQYEEKGIPFPGNWIAFKTIDRVDFLWENDPESGAPRLLVTVTRLNGDQHKGYASSLLGAAHPLSPSIAFMVDGKPQRIDLMPLASQEERRGKPRLVSIDFVLSGRGGITPPTEGKPGP